MRQIPTGIAPFAAIIDRKGTIAYVSNLGGRPPKPNELFASPMQKPDEKVTVNERGIASTGTVTRFDLKTGQATHTITVGLHPTALAWDERRQRLYVANGNQESIYGHRHIAESGHTNDPTYSLFRRTCVGIAPTALQVSADGKRLFAACGGINAVVVIDTAAGKIQGMIPTGWYPNGLALDPSGEYLAISSLLGARIRLARRAGTSASYIPIADRLRLFRFRTRRNSPVIQPLLLRTTGFDWVPARLQIASAAARNLPPTAVPVRSGEPSLIEHVVFIIKENRTYDQVLGDMTKGNGDPSLVMFGEKCHAEPAPPGRAVRAA